MRSYQADLSRRLGTVFAEQATQPKTTSDRNLPAPVHRVVVPLPAASKPTYWGYLSVGTRA